MSVHAEPPPALVSEPQGITYSTAEQLGKGGFAICYKAERLEQNRSTGHMVALKIVKSKMDPPKLAQKFVTELQIHSKLSHPNIVAFHRAFSFVENTYVVLELCSCGSLADLLRKRKCLTMPEIRRLMIQVCGAVKYLHTRNIVHRDLKTGNLFLDESMNVKVGDFGLAALLVSGKDMDVKRRTTMCGTPNYLAPEILEKGKGHSEKVDLWAIGIIAYTLAVGKAPFHAASKEEIYKKLKTGEYSWPELSSITNDISADLRNLVSLLLVPEELRPNPDEIVAHPFFKIAFVPTKMSRAQVNKVPIWPVQIPTAEVLNRGYSDGWLVVCKETGVGEYAPGKCFQLPGAQRIKSVVREIEREIATGRQPTMPIPGDTVYTANNSNGEWNAPTDVQPARQASRTVLQSQDPSHSDTQALTTARRPTTEETDAKRMRDAELMPPPKRLNDLAVNKTRTEPALTKTSNTTSTIQRKPASPRKQAASIAIKGSLTEANENVNPEALVVKVEPRDATLSRRPSTLRRDNSGRQLVSLTEHETKPRSEPLPVRTTRSRKAAAEVIEIFDDERRPTSDNLILPAAPVMQAKLPIPKKLAMEKVPVLIGSKPDQVLLRLRGLRDHLEGALAGRIAPSNRRNTPTTPALPFVSRWVDNSKKYGVGYILEDGTSGVIASPANGANEPVMYAVARNGESWLKMIGKKYENLDKVPLHLLESGANGIVQAGSAAQGDKERDRSRLLKVLWVKFGKFMAQTAPTAEPTEVNQDELQFVRLYQRLGNVGIWAFVDGCIQLNFPDHTKLVLSADGAFVSALLIPVDGAMAMAAQNALPSGALGNRQVLTLPIEKLIQVTRRATVTDQVTSLLRANMIEEKLEFVGEVLDQWIRGGGLGCSQDGDVQLKWDGLCAKEHAAKVEWTTVGRHGAD